MYLAWSMTYFHINLNPRGKFKKKCFAANCHILNYVLSFVFFVFSRFVLFFICYFLINVYFMNGLTKTHYQGGAGVGWGSRLWWNGANLTLPLPALSIVLSSLRAPSSLPGAGPPQSPPARGGLRPLPSERRWESVSSVNSCITSEKKNKACSVRVRQYACPLNTRPLTCKLVGFLNSCSV